MKSGYYCAIVLSSLLAIQAAAQEAGRTDVLSVIQKQTDVKNQGPRNLCTVFSITALVESLYLINHPGMRDIDLSEEWLHYLYTQTSASGGSSGAYQTTLFEKIKASGMSDEQYMPYDKNVWTAGSSPLATQRCAGLTSKSLTRCLMAHHRPGLLGVSDAELNNRSSANYDPDFASARASAVESKRQFINSLSGRVVSAEGARSRLRRGIPVSVKLKVYFGSWNHSHGDSLGIDRDPSLLAKGIVTYPEAGSLDEVKSRGDSAIHSVVLVGYDDNVEVTYNKKMTDGSTRTFTRKGVYYFKNSWGTAKFGNQFKLNGSRIPGFGMIIQDYANKGEFFAIDVAGN